MVEIRLTQIAGMDVETIRRERRELDEDLANRSADRTRGEGGGRPRTEKTTVPGGISRKDRKRNSRQSHERIEMAAEQSTETQP